MTKTAFNHLNKFQKRVSIAKDALVQLKIGKFISTRGNYLIFSDKNNYNYVDTDSAQKILQKASQCEVCAKGALVCSYVLKFNQVTIDKVRSSIQQYPEMIAIFGVPLWAIIEALFEGYSFNLEGVVEPDGDDTTNSKGKVYNVNHRKYSIVSIMKNIISNGGVYNYNGIIIQ